MGQADLPVAPARKHQKAWERLGWSFARQKGSHIILTKPGAHPVTIPDHGDVKRGLLAGQLRETGVSIEEYLEAYNA